MKKFAFVTALTVCAAALISLAPAQDMTKKILPTARLQVPAAVERTPEQMDAFEATAVMPGKAEVPFRPTMDAARYAQLKQMGSLAPRASRPGAGATSPSPLVSVPLAFSAATECDGTGGCWVPPDVAGAIGKTQFVSVSNNMFEVRDRTGILLKSKSLNAFFGYTKQAMFDPRVQYDKAYQRWVITADAFPESSTVQILGIAVSKTSSATGGFWVYKVNVGVIGGAGAFYDFPMLGISQDAVQFTANVFLPNNGFQGSSLFSLGKARIYNGLNFSVPVFTGLVATLEPSYQALGDDNPDVWLAAAPGNSSVIEMYYMGNASSPFHQVLHGPIAVTGVAAYGFPPAAPQPASCAPAGANLDTSDNRFQNAGTQNGDFYYQVHTTGDFNAPTPRYYIISGLNSHAPAVSVQNDFWLSSSSNDFNPSIATDSFGHFAINWSATDPANGVLASERVTDNNGGNPGGATGINVFTSASCYNGVGTSRWGDYSQTSADPGTGALSSAGNGVFWIDNETISGANFWSTEVAEIVF